MTEKAALRETAEGTQPTSTPASGSERVTRMLDPEVLGKLSIDIVAQLGRGAMTIEELARLKSGEVVSLDTPLNGMVELTLNGAVVARGEIVTVEDRFGVRVTEILVRAQ